MKMNFNKIFCLLVMGLVAFSCNESDDLVSKNAREGGLLTASSLSLNYVVGNPEGPYTLEFLVNQGNEQIKSIKLYKSFTKTVKYTVMEGGEEVERDSTFKSNEVLDRTLDISTTTNHFITSSYTFDELLNGLTIASVDAGPAPLPTNDGDYSIGDKWLFRVETVLDDSRVTQQAAPVALSVSTRYAGTYKPIAAEYYRLGAPTAALGDWPEEISIESVDATTYRVVEYFGYFPENEFYFQIVGDKITYPDETPSGDGQVGNDQPLITCESNPTDLAPVHCATSNYVVNDDAGGKDKLFMSFGYYTAGSGPRVFYQVLEKIVD